MKSKEQETKQLATLLPVVQCFLESNCQPLD